MVQTVNPLTPTVIIHVGTAIKHTVQDRVKPSFVIFDIRALWRSECPDVKNYKWRLNPVWHSMLYSCTRTGNSGRTVKGLNFLSTTVSTPSFISIVFSRSWMA